jgi:hypothetical protein
VGWGARSGLGGCGVGYAVWARGNARGCGAWAAGRTLDSWGRGGSGWTELAWRLGGMPTRWGALGGLATWYGPRAIRGRGESGNGPREEAGLRGGGLGGKRAGPRGVRVGRGQAKGGEARARWAGEGKGGMGLFPFLSYFLYILFFLLLQIEFLIKRMLHKFTHQTKWKNALA